MNSSGADTGTQAPAHSSDLGMLGLLHAVSALQERVDAALDTLGLTLPKYLTLKHLTEAVCDVSLGALAESRNCVRSNITQMIDRLVADGLVERANHPTDRRAVFAKITPVGEERFRDATNAMQTIQNDVMGGLTESDRASFVRVLSALRNA